MKLFSADQVSRNTKILVLLNFVTLIFLDYGFSQQTIKMIGGAILINIIAFISSIIYKDSSLKNWSLIFLFLDLFLFILLFLGDWNLNPFAIQIF